MPARTSPEKRRLVRRMVADGHSIAEAARSAGVAYNTARAILAGLDHHNGDTVRAARVEAGFPGPKRVDELSDVALRARDDFELYGRVFLGHVYQPWAVETAHAVLAAYESAEKEYLVENGPPGKGKSTLTHDMAAWLTTRDRRIRGLFGSRIENNGRRQCRRLKKTLERTTLYRAPSELVERGLAVDAELVLAKEYGLFRPATNDLWRADEFVVAQLDDDTGDEKEPTWSAYGMDSGVLGNRFNVIFWDDLVDKTTIRTLDAQEAQREWWDAEGETRLEPGGMMLLLGQRMAASDLYRYCLDKTTMVDEDDDGDEGESSAFYKHIVYRAHDEARCRGKETHRVDAPAWPDGCLLDPYRLPWRELRQIRATKPRIFAVSYQQEDADPEEVLVPEKWVWGGSDAEGVYPGCVDEDRGLCELPAGLAGPKISVAQVDPSGTKMWALQWWIHTPDAANQQFLMDLEDRAMPANELLDWNANEGRFYGWMETWQERSVRLGFPITAWIVEDNAAQRYLLQYDHVRRWMAKWSVRIIPHTTGPRKMNEDWGPWTIRDDYRFGRVRLPGKQPTRGGGDARIKTMKLVGQVTRWPNKGVKDDQVMAQWMGKHKFPTLYNPRKGRLPLLPRASWQRRRAS